MERPLACGKSRRRVCELPEPQRPNNRTADDEAGKNAHKEDDQFHDASKKNAEAPRPLRERDSPRRVEKKWNQA